MTTPKKNNYVHMISEALKEMGVEAAKGFTPSRAFIGSLNKVFELIRDPRKTVDENDYPLTAILGTTFLAIISDCKTWVDIENFAETKRDWLCRFYPCFRNKHNFQNKVGMQSRFTPSHDTFRRIMGLLPIYEVQNVLKSFLKASVNHLLKTYHIVTEEQRIHIALDGKVNRGSGRNYCASAGGSLSDYQTLNVYNSTYGITEYSFPIDSKTNEIPVAQRVLPRMYLNGVIVTADALHAQRETCRLIIEAYGDYILGLKGNQPSMKEILADVFHDEESLQNLFATEFTDKKKGATRKAHKYYKCETEKAHGQIEKREIYVFPVAKLPKPLADELTSKWTGLKSLVCIEKTIDPCDPSKEPTKEIRYYISSLEDIDLIFTYVRQHWAIEAHHFDCDYSFNCDDNQTMNKTAAENLFFFMKTVRTLLKYAACLFKGKSLKQIMKRIGWNDDYIGYFAGLVCPVESFIKEYKREFTEKELAEIKALYEECCAM